jgi:hypothetical protein
MKLTELTGIKNKNVPDEILNQKINKDVQFGYITALLQQNNFEKIGSGAYATIYKSKNSVLKVFTNDPAYEAYINFIKLIPVEYKKFVPKVTSVREFPQNKNIKFVKLPFYENLNMKQAIMINFINTVIHDMFLNKEKYYPNMINYNFKDIDEFMSTIEECGFFIRNNFQTTNLTDFTLEFFEFINFIRDAVPKRFYNDMHYGNFMYDEITKNIILTDPWATINH